MYEALHSKTKVGFESEEKDAMVVSFGFRARAPAASGAAEAAGAEEDEELAPPTKELVGELVDGRADAPSEEARVISAQGNTFHLGGAQHLRSKLDVPDSASNPTANAPSAVETAAVPNDDASVAKALLDEIRTSNSGSAAIFGANDDERYRLDVATRADEAAPDAYANMPIEEFGKAYLRGYDWKEGQGINGKGVAEPIEYVPRPQLLGLGAQPKPPGESSKEKRFVKPGESRQPKADMIYVDDQGRQRHVKKVGEKLVERGPSGLAKGAVVAITSGRHEGLYAKVLSSQGRNEKLRLVVKLMINNEQVTVSADNVRPIRDMQLERQRPGFTHEQARQLKLAESERENEECRRERSDRSTDRGEARGSNDEVNPRAHKKHRLESRETGGHGGEEHGDNKKKHKSSRAHGEITEAAERRLSWVRENIRVRVIDKRFSHGQLYNKKGVVVDVSGPDRFSVKMDEGGKLIEGLRHEYVVSLDSLCSPA